MTQTPLGLFSRWHGDSGAPVVLVHGSWGDHHDWDAAVPKLALTFRVLAYDRRGHSRSEPAATPGTIEDDVADLARMITQAGVAPAHVVGNSFGASIALKLAAARPELVASLALHEPPLFGLLENHPELPVIRGRMTAVMTTLESGRMELGAQQFVETVSVGPGMWDRLPSHMRQTFVLNAPTWLDEMREAGAYTIDLNRLAGFDRPALISQGDQSPLFLRAIADVIAEALPKMRRHTFRGSGHSPHRTQPDEFVRLVGDFVRAADEAAL